jgi:hypothetical protein
MVQSTLNILLTSLHVLTHRKNVTVVWDVTLCSLGVSDHNTECHTTDDRNCQ